MRRSRAKWRGNLSDRNSGAPRVRGLCCAAAAGLGMLAASSTASATGFMIREHTASAMGTASAGTGSRADSASTSFDNPAGMMRVAGSEIETGALVVLPFVEFNGSAVASGAPVPGAQGADAGTLSLLPNFYWTFDLTNRLKGGIAMTEPFGMGSEYDGSWSGRALGIKTAAASTDINPSIAYRLNSGLSLGAGFSAQYFQLEASTALPRASVSGPGAEDSRYRFNAGGWAYGYNAGALLELQSGTRLGLTYRSKMDHRIEGRVDFSGTAALTGLSHGATAAEIRLPATAGLSLTTDAAPEFSLSADVQFSQWSAFKQAVAESLNAPFMVDEGFRDSWMLATGGVYRLDDVWTLRGGLAWEPVPSASQIRTTALPDGDRYLAGFGFGYGVTARLSLDGGYLHAFGADNAVANTTLSSADPLSQAVSLAGRQSADTDVLALSVRFKY